MPAYRTRPALTKTPGSEITRILAALRGADRREALERLLPVVYGELRRLAKAQMRHERPDHTLQTTALVHEAYLRMLGAQNPPWNDRVHFFRAAAEAMRRILIEHARRRRRIKRGGDRVRVTLSGLKLGISEDPDTILALDDALGRLDKRDPRAADVVRLRFFAGLSVEETAKALEVSARTVKREWSFARAWLFDALGGTEG
jgi:RNA polymerase sigma factor (TIGR02999 family)